MERKILNISDKSPEELRAMAKFIVDNKHVFKANMIIFDFEKHQESEFNPDFKRLSDIGMLELLNSKLISRLIIRVKENGEIITIEKKLAKSMYELKEYINKS